MSNTQDCEGVDRKMPDLGQNTCDELTYNEVCDIFDRKLGHLRGSEMLSEGEKEAEENKSLLPISGSEYWKLKRAAWGQSIENFFPDTEWSLNPEKA